MYGVGWSKLNKTYEVQPAVLTLPTDADSIVHGRHLVQAVSLCGGCHGPDLGGGILFEVAALGKFPAPNLTAGQGGIGQTFSAADWDRALRHGVDPQGKTLMFMPSNHYYSYSDSDLADIIAFLKTVPPVDKTMPPRTLTPLMMVLVGLGQFDAELRAAAIDHNASRPVAPSAGPTPEYGGYLVTVSGCSECHGPGLVGRRPQEAQQGPPAGPNLTRGGELAGWSEADFIKALRTGIKPGGTQLSDEMPWKQVGQMSGEELKAVWLYLQALPPQPTP